MIRSISPHRLAVSRRRLALVFTLAILGTAWQPPGLGAQEGDWPGWRGRDMDLSATAAGVFEPGRSYRLEVAWKRPLGSGYSAISIVDGVAVTLFSDESREYAAAFSAASGEEIWRADIGARFPGRYGSQDGPVSTPLIAGGRVFALDPAGKLFAFDLESGDPLWTIDLPADHAAELPFYGFSTSPVAFGDLVILLTGGGSGKAVTAFDAATGDVRWQTGDDSISYQSPLLATVGGTTQLLIFGDKQLVGLDPASGNTLWTMEHGGDGRAIGSASTNVVPTSGDRFLLKSTAEGSILVEIGEGESGFTIDTLWETSQLKNSYVVPVVHNGHIFGYNTRILACVEAATGELVWRSRPPGDGFPIVVDGHLVIVTKGGTLSVAPASPDGYEEIASIELFDDLVWAPASFANGSLYVRSLAEWARVDIVEDTRQTLVEAEAGGVIADSEFGRMVAAVAAADDKAAVIDAYLKLQSGYPIVEGRELAHFVYRGPGDDIALVSDLFGGRTDRPMNRVPGTDLFYYSARLEPDARLTYSFLKDFEEPINPDPRNPDKTLIDEDEYSSVVAMPDWQAPAHLAEPEGGLRGRLEELQLTLPGSEESSTLTVYLPPGYDPSSRRYPVAYVPNGESRLEVGGMTRTLDNLIGKSVAPVIVVFVPHFGGSPYATYVGSGKGEYVRTLVDKVVPLVDQTFATDPAPESRALVGAWFTAYTSVYAAFEEAAAVFGGIGLQSVRWEPGYEAENQAFIAGSDRGPLTIYLDWGKYDWRSPMEGLDGPEMGRAFARVLEANGYPFVGGETHEGGGWPSWRNRTDRMLETLFPLR